MIFLSTLKGGDNLAIISPGIPNITGTVGAYDGQGVQTGAFYLTGLANIGAEVWVPRQRLMFDASRANKIYGAAETVQPPTIQLIPQIKY